MVRINQQPFPFHTHNPIAAVDFIYCIFPIVSYFCSFANYSILPVDIKTENVQTKKFTINFIVVFLYNFGTHKNKTFYISMKLWMLHCVPNILEIVDISKWLYGIFPIFIECIPCGNHTKTLFHLLKLYGNAQYGDIFHWLWSYSIFSEKKNVLSELNNGSDISTTNFIIYWMHSGWLQSHFYALDMVILYQTHIVDVALQWFVVWW